MKLSSPTSLLLNLGHAMDHWVLAIFLYTVSVIAGVWGADWKELTPYAFGASFMFGAGSVVSGKLGDQWGRRAMMVLFFAGMGVSCLVIALCQNKWQIGAALTLMGAFASIYHPVGIPMLVQKAEKPGFVIGVNGLVGNLGIALGSSVSVLLATRYGWQMAYVLPGVICLISAVLFAIAVPKEEEAPAKRRSKVLDLPPNIMARVFFIMTCAAVSGSIVFNFTTNGNGEMLKARIAELAQSPWLLSMALLVIFSVASLMQIVVGALIDRYPLKNIYLPILLCQVPLFLLGLPGRGLGAAHRYHALHGVRLRRHYYQGQRIIILKSDHEFKTSKLILTGYRFDGRAETALSAIEADVDPKSAACFLPYMFSQPGRYKINFSRPDGTIGEGRVGIVVE